jgi:hypothetical protein
MSEHNGSSPYLDVTIPDAARMQDYLLGGENNYAADRRASDEIQAAEPLVLPTLHSNRAFLRRTVTHLSTKAGIRQFIDIAAGLPTCGSTHQILQDINPDARVAYIDNNPQVVIQSRTLLTRDAGAIAILGDLHQPDAIMSDSALQTLLDLDRPIAVLLIAITHLIPDDDHLIGIIGDLRHAIAPGSYLVLSHAASVGMDPGRAALAVKIYDPASADPTFRIHDQVLRLLDGFELIEPGVVDVRHWRTTEQATDLPSTTFYGAVARKPLPWSPRHET